MKNSLPRHYWLIMFFWLWIWGAIGTCTGVLLGIGPYYGFIIGWCIPLFIEVFTLKRRRRRGY